MTSKAPHPEPEQPYDSSDPEQVDRREREAAVREKARLDVIAGVMGTPDGRAWIWSELVAAHIFHPSFVPGDDALTAAYREGERNRGLRLFALVLRAAPDGYVQMQREHA